jgi:hypothetical protein
MGTDGAKDTDAAAMMTSFAGRLDAPPGSQASSRGLSSNDCFFLVDGAAEDRGRDRKRETEQTEAAASNSGGHFCFSVRGGLSHASPDFRA